MDPRSLLTPSAPFSQTPLLAQARSRRRSYPSASRTGHQSPEQRAVCRSSSELRRRITDADTKPVAVRPASKALEMWRSRGRAGSPEQAPHQWSVLPVVLREGAYNSKIAGFPLHTEPLPHPQLCVAVPTDPKRCLTYTSEEPINKGSPVEDAATEEVKP